MSDTPEVKTEFVIEIKISEKNLAYKSDFSEAETVFWLESVKDLIIKKTFEAAGIVEG
jgi:hypothetical protein